MSSIKTTLSPPWAKIVSPSIQAYDEFQQILIKEFEFKGMATKIVLKEIKKVHSLPLENIVG